MSIDSIYDQLPQGDGHFRLLEVLPGSSDEPLYASLRTYDLANYPAYEAISYHWGTSEETVTVLVNDALLDVSTAAAAAIRSCRRTSGLVYLWIDQVCINQNDLRERSAQVNLMMSRIYSRADQVNVCLESHGEGPRFLFEFIEVLYKHRHPKWWSVNAWEAAPHGSGHPLSNLLESSLRLPSRAWRALAVYEEYADALVHDVALLLTNRWFRRAWVIQEATLAKRLIVVCGQHQTSWDALYELVSLQTSIYKQRKQSLPVLLGWKDVQYAEWREALANMRLSFGNFRHPRNLHLLGVMRQFRDWQATDGRDKVFGFLGLNPTWTANGLPFSSSYRATEGPTGYHVSVSHVCLAFAWHHIETTGTLGVIMASCHAATAHEDLPYWVPDWSQTAPLCDTWYGPWSSKWPFSTAGTRAVPEFIPSQKAIVLQGIEVDVVHKVVERCIDINTYRKPQDAIWTEWQDFAVEVYEPNDPYGETKERHFDVFWRALIYDTDDYSRRVTPVWDRVFRDWLAGHTNAESSEAPGRLIFKERKLFRTKRGYLGNACSNVLPGDKVFLLNGGRLPFVLREDRVAEGKTTALSTNDYRDGHKSMQGYRIVGGDSYVHGLCDEDVRRRIQEQYVCQEIALT